MSAWHASCDVEGGTKWVANLWFNLGLAEQMVTKQVARRPFARRPGRPIFGPHVVEDNKQVAFQGLNEA